MSELVGVCMGIGYLGRDVWAYLSMCKLFRGALLTYGGTRYVIFGSILYINPSPQHTKGVSFF